MNIKNYKAGTFNFDQPGNAARVAHHGLGIKGNMKKDNITDIAKNIDLLLSKNCFK